MVDLFEQNERKNARQSSKGNQVKWENENIWYKADYTGYEGLAEYMISHLLQKSSLKSEDFVLYELEEIRYKSQIYRGVKSKSFLKPGWQIITLERLYKNLTGQSLYEAVFRIRDVEERWEFLVGQVIRITGLKEFGVYLSRLFTVDAFFLNEDRHMHNIAVLMNDQSEFDYCPIFDNGAGLLADTTMDYPLGEDIYELMKTVESKTISLDFDEQLDTAEAMEGLRLKFSFNKKDVLQLLDGAAIYTEQERQRVADIIISQMNKYRYLFGD